MGEILRYENRAAWLQSRHTRIGASESAGVCNASRWATPLTVYNSKVFRRDTKATSIRLTVGNLIEPVIMQLYNEETGNACIPFTEWMGCEAGQEATVMHDHFPHIGATPDGIVPQDVSDRGEVNVQLKSAEPWTWPLWADGVPVYYTIQVQHEMECLPKRIQWTDLVTIFGYSELRIDRIPRDPELGSDIMNECDHFWRNHVLPRKPPPPTGKDVDREALTYWRPSTADTVDLPARFVALDAERLENAAQSKALLDRNDVIKAEVKAALIERDSVVGLLPDGRKYHWKDVERKAYTVAASSYDALYSPRAPKKGG